MFSQPCYVCTSGRHFELFVTNEAIIIHNNLQAPKIRATLTNANRQLLQVGPWTSHSALVLSTLALLVTLEVEMCNCITAWTNLIHLIPVVPRHQLALWVVPLHCSGHWSCALQTEHILLPPDSQRHV